MRRTSTSKHALRRITRLSTFDYDNIQLGGGYFFSLSVLLFLEFAIYLQRNKKKMHNKLKQNKNFSLASYIYMLGVILKFENKIKECV
jgi:hypothetical protein